MAIPEAQNLATYTSKGNAVGSTFTSTVGHLQRDGITDRPHCQIGVTFTDNDGAAATPGAGTYLITVETLQNPGVFQNIDDAPTAIDATAALQTYNFLANATRIRITPSGITTATKFDVYLTASMN